MKKKPQRPGRREIIKSGAQTSVPIELTEYVIVQKEGNRFILRNKEGKKEVWIHNQDFAGYVIRIGHNNYEFLHDAQST